MHPSHGLNVWSVHSILLFSAIGQPPNIVRTVFQVIVAVVVRRFVLARHAGNDPRGVSNPLNPAPMVRVEEFAVNTALYGLCIIGKTGQGASCWLMH